MPKPVQILRGLEGYEKLRAEWLAANPEADEVELVAVCIQFARVTGLVLRAGLLELQLAELRKGASDGG